MGFLTIINFIAMGIGYLILLLVLLFFSWLLIDNIKSKIQSRKWERESADKEKAKDILNKEGTEQGASSKPVVAPQSSQPSTNPVENSAETKSAESKPEEKNNKDSENLVDSSGKLKVLN